MSSEPANPPGLTKPTTEEIEANSAGRTPDLMHLMSKVRNAERSLTRPINGIEPSLTDQRSAAALRRTVDAAVRKCASMIETALVMHPAKRTT